MGDIFQFLMGPFFEYLYKMNDSDYKDFQHLISFATFVEKVAEAQNTIDLGKEHLYEEP